MKFFLVAAVLALAAADNTPSYGAPVHHQTSYAPAPAHRQASYAPAHQQSYDQPPVYDFNYDVHGYGDYEPQFNAQEGRDGYSTQGSYSVVLPDGRTQKVTYTVADAYSGYVADVTYEGEARYDQAYARPSYHPQPSYKPAHKPAASHY
ncbi:larval cuticle protein A3A-like [Pollicipes pollicipes]|uniref:larval cuticle protein A3A-like n=1 Tax=Pollicipes pollicipes TaxID=41117 RepID=UPI001885863C|nr:larval cuticle protein A3A-like [Pollicipes pollicipes]